VSRDSDLALVREYTKNENLVRHMLAVEAAVRAYARKYGEDEEKWGTVGLLHDFDYERWPDPPDHPLKGSAILKERGYPDDVIYAIKSHADYLTDCPRVSRLDKTLYACDELCGFLTACALVRPMRLGGSRRQGRPQENEAGVVRRGRQARRHHARRSRLEVDLDEHIEFCIQAMQSVAGDLGLVPAGPARNFPSQSRDPVAETIGKDQAFIASPGARRTEKGRSDFQPQPGDSARPRRLVDQRGPGFGQARGRIAGKLVRARCRRH